MARGHETNNDHSRDPCPYVIVNDIGIGFCMGVMGGTVWHGFKGYRNAPRGERYRGMVTAIKVRAPVIGGNFAVWSGMFNAGDCLLAGIRGKEDIWNPILAGAATGSLLSIRSGPKAMIFSGIFGGIILAVMEGVGVMLNRMNADQLKPQAMPVPDIQLPQLPIPEPAMDGPSLDTNLTTTSFESTSHDQSMGSNTDGQRKKGRFGFL